jgi:hypothetical protein
MLLAVFSLVTQSHQCSSALHALGLINRLSYAVMVKRITYYKGKGKEINNNDVNNIMTYSRVRIESSVVLSAAM